MLFYILLHKCCSTFGPSTNQLVSRHVYHRETKVEIGVFLWQNREGHHFSFIVISSKLVSIMFETETEEEKKEKS